ncbi:hypothetical protein [Variovorax saccharolyticus]|uniref:hypothetical protein n=1 Tax=Variovorax saccharolyticus TaxID=3053516 RepID=UPI002578E5A1|nr:hypothetical protein [Variovorax sp. J31P216]MDM0029915.1 hypothetical protein [Variovorax sp. J31P216]
MQREHPSFGEFTAKRCGAASTFSSPAQVKKLLRNNALSSGHARLQLPPIPEASQDAEMDPLEPGAARRGPPPIPLAWRDDEALAPLRSISAQLAANKLIQSVVEELHLALKGASPHQAERLVVCVALHDRDQRHHLARSSDPRVLRLVQEVIRDCPSWASRAKYLALGKAVEGRLAEMRGCSGERTSQGALPLDNRFLAELGLDSDLKLLSQDLSMRPMYACTTRPLSGTWMPVEPDRVGDLLARLAPKAGDVKKWTLYAAPSPELRKGRAFEVHVRAYSPNSLSVQFFNPVSYRLQIRKNELRQCGLSDLLHDVQHPASQENLGNVLGVAGMQASDFEQLEDFSAVADPHPAGIGGEDSFLVGALVLAVSLGDTAPGNDEVMGSGAWLNTHLTPQQFHAAFEFCIAEGRLEGLPQLLETFEEPTCALQWISASRGIRDPAGFRVLVQEVERWIANMEVDAEDLYRHQPDEDLYSSSGEDAIRDDLTREFRIIELGVRDVSKQLAHLLFTEHSDGMPAILKILGDPHPGIIAEIAFYLKRFCPDVPAFRTFVASMKTALGAQPACAHAVAQNGLSLIEALRLPPDSLPDEVTALQMVFTRVLRPMFMPSGAGRRY